MFTGWPEQRRFRAEPLTRVAVTLLRVLVARGDQWWGQVDDDAKAAFEAELEPRGYATRLGNNGLGRAHVTQRGILVLLAYRGIGHHPKDQMSGSRRLEVMRLRDDLGIE